MNCMTCGERMAGDGYSLVLHCPNTDPEGFEPDAKPVYCRVTTGCSREVKLELLAILRDLHRAGGATTGICGAVHHATRAGGSMGVCTLSSTLVASWPDRLHEMYPVEGDGAMYNAYGYVRWNRGHPIGARRWKLLDWMIAQLEESLK